MTIKLPPIQLLSAFESAARQLSIKKAAEEIHLTPSAVSQQIKNLETAIGHKLFRRETRALFLTEAGKEYYDVARKTLAQFKESQRTFDRRFNQKSLRLSLLPFMANELLIPKLSSFYHQHPNIELRVETGMTPADFDNLDIDAAVRIGTGLWPGLHSQKLCDLQAILVCSPNYFKKKNPTLKDIKSATLLHEIDNTDWNQVAAFEGKKSFKAMQNLFLDSDLATVTAAVNGLGIAIGLHPFIGPLIADGRLISPFSKSYPCPVSCYYVVRDRDLDNSNLLDILRWLENVIAK